jgi:hypothetical protein
MCGFASVPASGRLATVEPLSARPSSRSFITRFTPSLTLFLVLNDLPILAAPS